MIDEGEADWKVLVINVNDPLASKLNDLNDLNVEIPGILDYTRDWFRIYKIPDGKPQNRFASNGTFFDRDFSLDLIKHAHQAWLKLSNQTSNEKISLLNTNLNNKHTISNKKAKQIVLEFKHNILKSQKRENKKIDEMHYVNRNKLTD